ncbi:30S ribosomal protein S15 [Candidatus Phytoplasma oryzae]|nr:30S ribosomal protein S15 [Candidatus Phytoplasma oryzae]
MNLVKEKKQKIISKYDPELKNTGCCSVQIDLLSYEIEKLNKHLKEHPSDFHSKRGLLTKNKKRNALNQYYLKKINKK